MGVEAKRSSRPKRRASRGPAPSRARARTSSSSERGFPADGQAVRYAVVGLGYISQVAVLPAFRNAGRNSKLVALVSGDAEKLQQLSRRYRVERTYSYESYQACLESGQVDAVYIALPNNQHAEFAVRAAEHGIHVLCEKPMAVTESECESMIRAAEKNHVKLMIAYRLHFEEANLRVAEIVRTGKIGEPRSFLSSFSQQVKEGDIRLQRDLGGGTLYDIGIYCINAARSLFGAEPIQAVALSENSGDPRFREVDETTSAILRFPGECLATFVTSFGATDTSWFQIVGTEGEVRLEHAYEYASEMTLRWTVRGRTTERRYAKRDQFGPELLYFSRCILDGREPEPSGLEGLADVRVIDALYKSVKTSRPIELGEFEKTRRPTLEQAISRPPVAKPDLVHAESPSGS